MRNMVEGSGSLPLHHAASRRGPPPRDKLGEGSTMKVAVLLSGTGSNMAALLYASRLADCAYRIVLVASDRSDAPGLTLAEAEGVRTVAIPREGRSKAEQEAALQAALKDSGAELVALAGYMRVLSPEFVAVWQGRMLNIHPSLLPRYKGLDTHARALAAGDVEAGCSVHLVTAELDEGPVLGRLAVAVRPDDTAATLAARVLIAEHQLYPRVLADFAGRESDPEWIVERVGSLALVLPETSARTSHGAPGWRVGGDSAGKFFAYVSIHHHGEAPIALLVKTSGPDEMAALIEAEPGLYYRPAYYGASGWVALRLDGRPVDWNHVADWLERSWRRVAPKRLTKLMRAAEEF